MLRFMRRQVGMQLVVLAKPRQNLRYISAEIN
jgi:hypothetical protein